MWEADASAVDSLSTLQQQQQSQLATWSSVDASAVSVANGAIELHAQADTSPNLQISLALNGNFSLHRLQLRTQLPQDGQATLRVQLPVLDQLTMALGSAPAGSASNEVFLGSSQNTSVVAELPCISDVADTFHDVEFVWDDQWMRWYVDQVLLLEEFIRDAEEIDRSGSDGDRNVLVDLSVEGSRSGAKLAVERIALSSGNLSDPFCAPRYSSSSNCRALECTSIYSLSDAHE